MGKPIEVSDLTAETIINKHPVFVLDCFATWCGPCKMMNPIINKLAAELKDKVIFGKLDVDTQPQTSDKYEVKAIPTFLIFQKGKLAARHEGTLSEVALRTMITKLL